MDIDICVSVQNSCYARMFISSLNSRLTGTYQGKGPAPAVITHMMDCDRNTLNMRIEVSTFQIWGMFSMDGCQP